MSGIKKVIGVILGALALVVVIMNIAYLTRPLKFNFLNMFEADLPAGLWMLFSFVLGFSLLKVIEAWRGFGKSMIIKDLNKQIVKITKTVEKYEKENGVYILSTEEPAAIEEKAEES